ncbi:MAG: tyrosinase family protein [Saprospiraceae bacterium]
MKNSFTLIGLICVVFGAYFAQTSFTSKSEYTPSNVVPDLAMCASNPQPSIPDAKLFDPAAYNTPVVMVRRNINSFTPAQIASLKAGINAMKALPTANPTSWTYQAAIHGSDSPSALPSWNSCEHGTEFFLSWHRMYLYFFERILRAKSGDPSLTLPYWDYQTDGVLHAAYRDAAANNPLFDASRAPSINAGASLPPSISTDINTSLNQIPFFDFQGELEGPHGGVHVAVGGNGGNMRRIDRAALDPCFWLHHTNVDRLWQVWLSKCNQRTNPADRTWLSQTYTFFDETGTAVNMTGDQVLKTANSLNYRYDTPVAVACNFKVDKFMYQKFTKLSLPTQITIRNSTERVVVKDAKVENTKTALNQAAFKFKGEDANDRVMIDLINPQLKSSPDGVIEVYVNLPKNATPTVESNSYAGTLNLFNLTISDQKRRNAPLRVNVTQAVKKLKLKPQDLTNIELTFFVRGNKLQGKEIETKADISAESIDIVFERPEKVIK